MRVSPSGRLPVVLVSALAVTAGLLAAAPAVAAATVTVTDQTGPLAPVSLSRLHTADVTMTFRVVSSDGQSRVPQLLDRTRKVPFAPVRATPVSGDDNDGVWEATVTLGSFMDGTHHPRVRVCTSATSCVVRNLSHDIVVRGSDWPTLGRIRQHPTRLSAGDVSGAKAHGRVVFSSSHDPVRRVVVRLATQAGDRGRLVDTTNRRGEFTSPWPWTMPGMDPARISVITPAVPGVRFDSTVLGNPRTRFLVQRPHAPAVSKPGRRFVVKGIVTPGYPASRLGKVKLQELTDSRWVTRDHAQVRPVKSGSGPLNRARYRLVTRFQHNGKHVLRVVKPEAMCGGDACRVAEGTSKRFSVVTGNQAYFVEARLNHLNVPVGTVDGVVDARSRQAFCAWRDMTGQKPSRRGLTPGLVSSVMRAHSLPAPKRSNGLYVNKTCQMLFQVERHAFKRVVWVSSGQPGYDTPNGTGAIFRKVKGWVESTLYPGAYMLDPMFFFPERPAIAIHGSASNSLVYPYPASHGCVRTYRPEVRRIFKDSPLGTKVKVYGRY